MNFNIKKIAFLMTFVIILFLASCTEGEASIVKHKVTFYDFYNNVITEETVIDGENASAPNNLEVEGHTFIGWDQELTNITTDLTVNSTYERNSYTLTFLVDGEVHDTQTVKYGSGGLKPAKPVKEGYTFIDWDDGFHFILEDTNINAIFQKDELVTYTVTFYDDNGADIIHAEVISKGGKVTKIDDPIKENAIFSKWVVRSYSAAFDFNTEINRDYDLIAVYDEFTEFDLVRNSPDFYTVYGYLGTKTNIVIPSTYKGLPVAVIQSGAFENSNFESVFIPNSITTIHANAFKNSVSLSSVIFEENSSLTFIGNNSFMGTSNLTSINIPNSVTVINQTAFSSTGLINVTFEEGSNLKTISNGAFSHNLGIVTLTIPKSVTLIGDFAFKGLENMTTFDIEANSELVTINASAFEDNYMLKSFHVPNKVKLINNIAFQNARSLESLTFEENSSLEIIGDDAFRLSAWGSYSSGLDLIIPKSVIEIGRRSFRETRVNSLVFEENSSLTTIGYDAFYMSGNIGTLMIPKTVVEIRPGTFQFAGLRNLSFEDNSELTIIGKEAFYGNILNSITLPASLKSINQEAFRNSGLVSVYFEQDSLLETIELRAFSNNDLLRYFVLPGTVTTMGTHIFLYNEKLETLIIYVTILSGSHPDWPTNWAPYNSFINWASDWSYNEDGLPKRNND